MVIETYKTFKLQCILTNDVLKVLEDEEIKIIC